MRVRIVSFASMHASRSAAGAIALVLTACGPSALEGGYDSANPAAKMYAIERSAEVAAAADVPRIVEQLDSDDPAVRLMAIAALERLTGQTHGYRHYDPPDLRREAVARWTAALRPPEAAVPASEAQPGLGGDPSPAGRAPHLR
jgi:hypothetical protein